jgi:metal-dependent amidase/aminoacylase/carboxypeptidase family protein
MTARHAALAPLVAEAIPDVLAWRRHLHRYPELAFEEQRTAAYVAERLVELGLRPMHPTPTSVLAELGSGDGPTIALRADLDALPIGEETGRPQR